MRKGYIRHGSNIKQIKGMKHVRLTANENGDNLFVCTFSGCGRQFKTKFSMSRHSLVHNQEKNYACEYCGKKFALLQYLKEHTNTHTNDKPYVCGVSGCQERFSQTGKLSLHRRTHPEYMLKEYHSNASYNKRRKLETNGMTQESPQTAPKKVESAPAASVKSNDSVKAGITAPKRTLLRLDSGQAITSTTGNEGFHHHVFMPYHPPSKCPTPPTKASPSPDVRISAAAIAFEFDPLIRYLNFLQMPFSSVLRPVLPLPEKIRAQKIPIPYQHTEINLFELTSKANN